MLTIPKRPLGSLGTYSDHYSITLKINIKLKPIENVKCINWSHLGGIENAN